MPTYNSSIRSYILHTYASEDETLAHIRGAIPAYGFPAISITPEEGRFLQFLAGVSRAGIALEIGTLGGYSGIWIARGMPLDSKLITIEKWPERASLAKEHFQLAGVSERIEIRVGDAHKLLPELSNEGPFDLIFIDAEKEGYPAYLKWSLANLRPGGVLAAHNVFQQGAVVDPTAQDPDTKAIRSFNQQLANDPRTISTIFPAGDGMAIAVLKA